MPTKAFSLTPPASLIDEYGETQRACDEFAPIFAKAKRLKSEIESHYAAEDPGCEYTAQGNLYTLQVGPKSKQRTITARGMERLYKLLGKIKFLEWCTFKLTDLDRLAPDAKGIVEEARTGPRRIHAVPRRAVEAA
jgi:hypothetical protein